MAVAEAIALLAEDTAGVTDATCAWAEATAAAAAAIPAGVK